VPPETVRSIAPFEPPKHNTLVTDTEGFKAVGCVTVAEMVAVQLLASVAVTV